MISQSNEIWITENVSIRALVEYPGRYSEELGSSPGLTSYLLGALSEYRIQRLRGLWYLYNNQALHSKFAELLEDGADVSVHSIPLEGYTKTRRGVHEPFSKYDAAKLIYESSSASEFLRTFPETLVRSTRMVQFSRGKLPYSLHAKGLYFESEDFDNLFLTSSNMSLIDDSKIEIGLHVKARKDGGLQSLKEFFDFVPRARASVRLGNAPILIQPTGSWVSDSNLQLCRILESFGSRPGGDSDMMFAQHISGVTERLVDGSIFTSPLYRMIDEGAIHKMVSQTSASGVGRTVKNARANFALEEHAFNKGVEWRTHVDLHAKFLVHGDYSLISTSNFTNTSLIWLRDTQISPRLETPFSEVGISVVIKSGELSSFLLREGLKIWDLSKKIHQDR